MSAKQTRMASDQEQAAQARISNETINRGLDRLQNCMIKCVVNQEATLVDVKTLETKLEELEMTLAEMKSKKDADARRDEKMRLAKIEAMKSKKDAENAEKVFLFSVLASGVQCSGIRKTTYDNCTIIKAHPSKTTYTVLFEDCTVPLKNFPLERLSTWRVPDSKPLKRLLASQEACAALLAEAEDAVNDAANDAANDAVEDK